jgi:hypothetical protein
MCELLVRVVDKINDDPYLDAQCSKRGDVIVVVEDGHAWGREEIANPDWTIIKVPGVAAKDATGFVARELNYSEQPNYMLQKRAFAFDLTQRPTDLQSLLAAKVRKPALDDPNILG